MPTMTQTDRIAQLKRVFENSMLWGDAMTQHDVNLIYAEYYKDVEDAISETLRFIEFYQTKYFIHNRPNYGEHRDELEIYTVCCLPWLIPNFKFQNPDVEDRARRHEKLKFLEYIRANKSKASDTIKGIIRPEDTFLIDDEKLRFSIAYIKWGLYKYTISGYTNASEFTKAIEEYGYQPEERIKHKVCFWSDGESCLIQFQYLMYIISKCFKSTDRQSKVDMVRQFFETFIEDERDAVPESSLIEMISQQKKNPMIDAPSQEKINEILAQPNNKLTEEEIRAEYNPDFAEYLIS